MTFTEKFFLFFFIISKCMFIISFKSEGWFGLKAVFGDIYGRKTRYLGTVGQSEG